MINKKYSIIVGIFLLLAIFVLATAAIAPTNVVFNNNVTSLYDEGSFIVNWTNATTDTGYTIYIWMNDVLVNTTASNNSATAMTFVNSTEANYTFTVEALNGTSGFSANASNVSMYIDTTAPVINLVDYTNATLKNATSTLELNISVTDLLSGETGSYCLVDINGTNETIAVASNWCNSTVFNLTGLSDGNHTIDVHVNDTVNNFGVNNSYIVWIDSTAPSTTLSLTSYFPTSINLAFTTSDGTCTSNRGTVSGTTITETGLSCAKSYSYTLTCIDSVGNRASRTTSYSTSSCSGLAGSSSSFEGSTFVLSESQFVEGFMRALPVGDRIKFKANNEDHYVEILSLTSNTVKINVSSDPQQATLSIGDSRKFELNGDNFYDLLVTLNSINSNKADITTKSINEEITDETIADEEEEEEAASGEAKSEEAGEVSEKKNNLVALWIVIGLVIIIIVWYLFRKRMKK